MAKRIRKLFQKYEIPLHVTFSANKIRSSLSLKDSTGKLLQSGVIYKFQCQVDPDKSYIGKTSRHLFRRIGEHMKPSGQLFSHFSNCPTCKTSHIKCFKTIDSASSDFSLSILEALYIRKNSPSLNK